jgi:hypothetical protein
MSSSPVIAFGDLEGNGAQDAVTTYQLCGADCTMGLYVVSNINGKAQVIGKTLLEKGTVQSLSISNQEVTVTIVPWTPLGNTPAVTLTYELSNGSLIEVYPSTNSGNLEAITSPSAGQSVQGGSITNVRWANIPGSSVFISLDDQNRGSLGAAGLLEASAPNIGSSSVVFPNWLGKFTIELDPRDVSNNKVISDVFSIVPPAGSPGAAMPSITSISAPSYSSSCATGYTVTVHGQNFTPSSNVYVTENDASHAIGWSIGSQSPFSSVSSDGTSMTLQFDFPYYTEDGPAAHSTVTVQVANDTNKISNAMTFTTPSIQGGCGQG